LTAALQRNCGEAVSAAIVRIANEIHTALSALARGFGPVHHGVG
jgi:hypothetical protein